MIQILLLLAVTFPIIIGIASVTFEGEEYPIIQRIIDARESGNLDMSFIANMTGAGQQEEEPEPMKPVVDGQIEPDETLIVLPEEVNELLTMISKGIVFMALYARDFGVWIGMSTAPFHYVVAVLLAFTFFFPTLWLFIIGFFYILIKERKEIRHVAISGLKEDEIPETLKMAGHEVIQEIKGRLKRNSNK